MAVGGGEGVLQEYGVTEECRGGGDEGTSWEYIDLHIAQHIG